MLTRTLFILLLLLQCRVVSCVVFTVTQQQRLTATPLSSLVVQQTGAALPHGRCVLACKMWPPCRSLNVLWQASTSLVTCQLLGVYSHEVPGGLTYDPQSVFIQETLVSEDSWLLALSIKARIGQSAYDMLLQDGRHDDASEMPGCVLPERCLPCSSHFRSYLLDTWTNIDKVRLTVYTDGVVTSELTLDGRNSTRLTWLDRQRLLTSSWVNLKTTSSNYFSIDGYTTYYRRFYINKSHSGCNTDEGWLAVVDVHPSSATLPCAWSWNHTLPAILHSSSNSSLPWIRSSEGDILQVHVTLLA